MRPDERPIILDAACVLSGLIFGRALFWVGAKLRGSK